MAELTEQEQQQSGNSQKARRSHTGLWFGVILLIVIGLGSAGFYLFSQLRDRQENLGGEVKGELNKQIADYQNQLSAIQSQLAALEANIAGKDTHFTKTLADFSALHNQKLDAVRKELNESIVHVQRQLGKTRGDWLVADAEYLLGIANERLHLIGDINTTKEALEAADQRLRESGDAAAYKVREQIAKEIALLNSVAVPDIVGMYAKVESLEAQVDKLELTLAYAGKPLAVPSKEAHNPAAGDDEGHSLLDSALAKLEGIVTVRRVDQSINEVLTPEEAQFIREQLRVKLEMVKIALVQHNETLFQSSLNDARNWINRHFHQNKLRENLLAQINQLASIKISSHFPDISQSLKMLRDITKLRIETDKAIDNVTEPRQPTIPAPVDPVAKPEASKPATP